MSFDLNEIARLKALAEKMGDLDSTSQAVKKAAEMNIVQRELDKAVNNSSAIEYAKLMQAEEQRKQFASPYLDNSTVAALHKNYENSMQLENEIAKFVGTSSAYELYLADKKILDEQKVDVQSVHIPHLHIQKNPIHETNQKLDKLQQNIEDLRPMALHAAQLINSLNDVAVSMQVEGAKNVAHSSEQTKIAITQTKIAIWLSFASLVISSIFSIKTSIDSNEASEKSEAQLKVFQSEIRAITAAQADGNAALVRAISDSANKSVKLEKK